MKLPRYFYFRVLQGFDGVALEDASEVDVVEVVRCKDCKYCEWTSNRVPEEQTWWCYKHYTETGYNDYCSYGERKENGKIH